MMARLVRALRRLVALGLAREAAVEVAYGALIVALERVEVLVRARLLRVPRVEDRGLGLDAPDVVEGRDVVHRRGDGAGLDGRAHGEGRGSRGEHCLRRRLP